MFQAWDNFFLKKEIYIYIFLIATNHIAAASFFFFLFLFKHFFSGNINLCFTVFKIKVLTWGLQNSISGMEDLFCVLNVND